MLRINDPDYLKTVYTCWARYVVNDEPMPLLSPGPRAEIWESWRRSKAHHVSPGIPQDTSLTPSGFQKRLQENCALIRSFDSYLSGFLPHLKENSLLIQLCDRKGCVLKTILQDDPSAPMPRSISKFFKGYAADEASAGTNSTSLCLVSEQPVQVYGEEHYLSINHMFAGFSSPVSCGGEMIGVLTMILPKEAYRPHMLGAVAMAARGIEKEAGLQHALLNLHAREAVIETIVSTAKSGILVLDSCLRIVFCNREALRALRLNTAADVRGKHIFTLLQKKSLPARIRSLDTDYPSSRISVINGDGVRTGVFLQVDQIRNQMQDTDNIVLTITPQTPAAPGPQVRENARTLHAAYTFDSIIGTSREISDVKRIGEKAARSASNVLLLGESGVGKELFAQAIHNAGPRRDGPFVAVNCGSIPGGLIESEFFGYEGGAFTGANRNGNPGKFELAEGGTLFLDEIGDMPLELQASLLRVIQEREFTPIGATYTKKVDVRIIAATNTDLLAAVNSRRFRADLYYRLAVIDIPIPPLRERREDILPLTQHFLRLHEKDLNKKQVRIDSRALELLLLYDWPGNVRELENVIERSLNQMSGNILTVSDLPSDLQSCRQKTARPVPSQAVSPVSPEIQECNEIIRFLEEENGHVKSVAQRMQIPVSTLYRKINKYNLTPGDFRKW